MSRIYSKLMIAVATFSILLLSHTSNAYADEFAVRYKFDDTVGLYAAFEAGYPQIRDGGYSDMRLSLDDGIGPTLIRIGWTIDTSHTSPTAYWTWVDTTGSYFGSYGGVQGCCTGYNYKIERAFTPGTWWLYFNSLSVPVATIDTVATYGTFIDVGGQTSSSANAMGVSGNWNVAWRHNPSNTWYSAGPDWQDLITNPIYGIADIAYASWQVYGNN